MEYNKIVNGGLFAGGFNLFVGGGQLGDPQVDFDAVVEELGLLRHKALQIAQIFGVDLFHRSADVYKRQGQNSFHEITNLSYPSFMILLDTISRLLLKQNIP